MKMLELIKDYNFGINYHPRETNMVADTLSQRTHLSQLEVEIIDCPCCAKSSIS
jgi:hypothetical protein